MISGGYDQRPSPSCAPHRLQLVCPRAAAAQAQGQLIRVLAETALDDWFTLAAPIPGAWSLWWDDTPIWSGPDPNPPAWRDALLEGWWGSGGGCC
ncbi:MAG: hypothetical protein C7B45_17025 [Sulfobacillus acidophilus]|uniref:Uncharacterized protein n=1 Tax=Sulfobacillus acidophilus TaxID=53633 RepID=A0A2T2WCP6_9FIRM|nr:MAG: hypothetical protein C7B45_17025 [Sulfobacillus acidophilus]